MPERKETALPTPIVPPRGLKTQGTEGVIHDACVESPALRELVLTWQRRSDLRSVFPLATEGDLDGLLKWALVSGVNEEPALAELSSELAVLVRRSRGAGVRLSSARVPTRVHVVSLASFPESFRNCADSLERGLRQGGLTVEHHREANAATLAALARTDSDEVVHVVGQGDISELLHSPSRNWLLTIHGAAPYSLPIDLHPAPSAILEELRAHIGRVPWVICGSFSARREISVAYGLPLDCIDPVPYFFDSDTFSPDGSRYEVEGRYFLVVSNYQRSKNFVAVLEAFYELISRDFSEGLLLLITGGPTPELSQLLEETLARWPVLKGRVQFLGHVENLVPVYRGAIALVSMSHKESFGMPYIEAALCRTPVIGPKRSIRAAAWAAQSTQEILGRAGLYADPQHPLDLTTMMAILAGDEGAREAVAHRCFERAKEYVDPAFLFRRYLHIYGKVLERS